MCFLVAGVGVYPFLAVFFSFSVSIFVQRLRMLDRHRSYNFYTRLCALSSARALRGLVIDDEEEQTTWGLTQVAVASRPDGL